MKKIKLTNSDKYTIVDDKDFRKVHQFKWYLDKNGYAVNRYKIGKGKITYLHRFILNFPESHIDHKNGNPLDNKKFNLRLCSMRENSRNQKISKNNKSGFKGVYYFPYGRRIKRWKVAIKLSDKKSISKYCKTKQEAAKKYNELALKHFGEFARINEL